MSSGRLKEISDLIDNIKPIETKNRDNEIIKQIKNKFVGIFDEYSYIEGNKINTGDIIRYVDLGLTKVSIPGIVMELHYDDQLLSTNLDNILLFNKNKKTFWRISPKSVYIFRSYKLGKMSKKYSLQLTSKFFENELNEYKALYNNGLLD